MQHAQMHRQLGPAAGPPKSRAHPVGRGPALGDWLSLESFEYRTQQRDRAVLEVVGRLEGQLGTPRGAMLVIRGQRGVSRQGSYSTRSWTRWRDGERDRNQTGLIWRVSFSVPLDVVEYPHALFNLHISKRGQIALPRPDLQASLEPSPDHAGGIRLGGVRRHLAALTAGFAVAAACGTAAGGALAGTAPTGADATSATTTTTTTTPASTTTPAPAPTTTTSAPPTNGDSGSTTTTTTTAITTTTPPPTTPTPPPVTTTTPGPTTTITPTRPAPLSPPAQHRPVPTPPGNASGHHRHHPGTRTPTPHPGRPTAPGSKSSHEHKHKHGKHRGGASRHHHLPAGHYGHHHRKTSHVMPAGLAPSDPSLSSGLAVSAGAFSIDPFYAAELNRFSATLGSAEQPPAFLIPIYRAAGRRYHVPWRILAAINAIETDYGRNLSISSAGAFGWMQFMPATWLEYGVAVRGHGRPNAYDPRDAIFTAARYLAANGAAHDLPGAIFAYNHAAWYVDAVLWRAQTISGSASDSALSKTGYALPLDGRYMHQLGRTDDGVDIETAPDGVAVYSITPGVVTAVAGDPGGFGPNYPVVLVTAGPLAGQEIYYGHVAASLVRVGEHVSAGQPIAVMGHTGDAASLGHGHIEIGFSNASGDPIDHHGGEAWTPAGAAMRQVLTALSRGAGIKNS